MNVIPMPINVVRMTYPLVEVQVSLLAIFVAQGVAN
jgi:hypothetical protein